MIYFARKLVVNTLVLFFAPNSVSLGQNRTNFLHDRSSKYVAFHCEIHSSYFPFILVGSVYISLLHACSTFFILLRVCLPAVVMEFYNFFCDFRNLSWFVFANCLRLLVVCYFLSLLHLNYTVIVLDCSCMLGFDRIHSCVRLPNLLKIFLKIDVR